MAQSEGARNLICHYYMMVPSGCLVYTPPVDKHSKLCILKFGIKTVLGFIWIMCASLSFSSDTNTYMYFVRFSAPILIILHIKIS